MPGRVTPREPRSAESAEAVVAFDSDDEGPNGEEGETPRNLEGTKSQMTRHLDGGHRGVSAGRLRPARLSPRSTRASGSSGGFAEGRSGSRSVATGGSALRRVAWASKRPKRRRSGSPEAR